MLLWALALVHAIVSLTWFAAAVTCPTRAVFFGAGALVFTHVATGLALALVRMRHTWRFFCWAIAVTDVLGLGGLVLYAINLVQARVLAAPATTFAEAQAAGAVQLLARDIWVEVPALAVFVLALIVVTMVVQVGTATTLLVVVLSKRCRMRCHPARGYYDDLDDATGASTGADADDDRAEVRAIEARDASRRARRERYGSS